jgi:hypothetical protein
VATKAEIKKAILSVAGNPETGVVKEMADAWADAIFAIDNPESASVVAEASSASPAKETRVISASEKR